LALAIISNKRLRDLLVNALEGGSNYWIEEINPELKAGSTLKDFCEGGKEQPEDDYFHWSQLVPTTPGHSLLVKPEEFFPVALNLKALRQGANIMATNWPRHWANVLTENDDAETGDVLLQCAVFGDIIFG
jgi:hypothetical protein